MASKLGIVAGGGALPARLVEACRAKGWPVALVAIEGQAEPGPIAGINPVRLPLGSPGRALRYARSEGVERVVFVGALRRPRGLRDLLAIGFPDWVAWSFIFGRRGAILRDDGFLRAVAHAAEKFGLEVVGVETIDPSLLAAEGRYGRLAPDAESARDIEIGIAAAQSIGRVDRGQGAIVHRGQVIATERADGTDAMIARAGALLARLRGADAKGGVLVKVKKPGQEARMDLPTIGLRTIERARAAGLAGIAVEAGAALVLDREALARAADAAGLFVVGVKVPESSAETRGAGQGPLIYLMAGEPSGDALGARLMAALKRETNGAVRFAGIGGERMIGEGLASDFPMAELSIMGLAEVLPKAPQILRRVRETVARIRDLEPDAVVSIDATGFCFRVEKRLKAARAGIPLIHYVAPMVWAWRPWKAKLVAKFLDRLLVLLPFEPPYFEKEGLATSFVGHPVIEEGADKGDGKGFRARHGIPEDAPLLAVLPGSRHGEVKRLLPVFGASLGLLAARFPGLRAVVATVETVADEVAAAIRSWPVPTTLVRGTAEKFDAFAAANAALAASGTVSIELALARCPMTIAYKVSPATAWLLRHYYFRHRRVNYASIVNILADRPAIPELLQDDCRSDRLAETVGRFLSDEAARRAQIEGAAPALASLGAVGVAPSIAAARAVLETIAHKTKAAPAS